MAKYSVTPSDADRLAQVLSFLQNAQSQAIRRESARYLKYNATDFAALRFVDGNARPTPSALARHLGLPATTVTSLLDRLEDKELISRAPSTRDRRRIALSLTARGKRALAAISAEDRAFATHMLARLDRDRQGAALAGLEAMSGLEEQDAGSDKAAQTPRAKRGLLGRKAKPSANTAAKTAPKTAEPKMATDRITTDRIKPRGKS